MLICTKMTEDMPLLPADCLAGNDLQHITERRAGKKERLCLSAVLVSRKNNADELSNWKIELAQQDRWSERTKEPNYNWKATVAPQAHFAIVRIQTFTVDSRAVRKRTSKCFCTSNLNRDRKK